MCMSGRVLCATALWLLLMCAEIRAFTPIKRRYAMPARQAHKRELHMREGRIVVTGIGEVEDDEFCLSLLNDQETWESILLASGDAKATNKRFLSRTARYSGLLNHLEFAENTLDTAEQRASLLQDASTWVAFNVAQSDISKYAKAALSAGVSQVLFTTALPVSRLNDTTIPEFESAVSDFEAAGNGTSFIGIRHPPIVDGSEDNAYEIYEPSTPCLEDTVEKGVLARVATELLRIPGAANKVCGVSSAGPFSAAYLNVLRSSGLTRTQEVAKLFEGGTQRMARKTVEKYEQDAADREAAKQAKKKRRLEREAEEAAEAAEAAEATSLASSSSSSAAAAAAGGVAGLAVRARVDCRDDGELSITPGWDEDQADEGKLTPAQELVERTDEILSRVYAEYSARMYAKSTSKKDFFDQNRDMARNLAEKEFAAARLAAQETAEQAEARQRMLDQRMDVNRKQYSKLLALERKEIENQKVISDTWVKYIYLLLETTIARCERSDDESFFKKDRFAQTLVLRDTANEMRAAQGLPSYDVVYDPLDAGIIVTSYSGTEPVDLTRDIDVISDELMQKYGTTLKSVPALRGAQQIVELAIETLRREIPAAEPLPVSEKLSQ